MSQNEKNRSCLVIAFLHGGEYNEDIVIQKRRDERHAAVVLSQKEVMTIMNHPTKKTGILLRALLLALCLCLLAGCGDSSVTTGTTSDSGTGAPAPTPTPSEPLALIENGETAYKIVYAKEGETWEKSFAYSIQSTVLAATGVRIPIESDDRSAADANAKEILVGTAQSNRSATYTARGGVGLGHHVFVDGNRLVFEVYSKTGAFFALSAFCKDYFNADPEQGEEPTLNEALKTLTVAADTAYTRTLASAELPYLGVPMNEFMVACDEMNFLQKSLAQVLAEALADAIGSKQEPFLYDAFMGLEDEGAYFLLKEDETLTSGDWRYRVMSDRMIELSAGDYFGFLGAINAIAARTTDGYYFTLCVADADEGNYFDTMEDSEVERTSRYAYDRQGDHRVMFYNALWGNSTANKSSVFNAIYRDVLQEALIEAYMPDVLALQEINKTRRGKDNSGDLVRLIEGLGYVETIDPRVKNAIPVEEGGYGTNGAVEVTVDGETYYTYFNTNPLFYNPKTTKYIEGARVEFSVHGLGDEVVNAGEAGSKSMTWGLFESIATGDRYIVASTHMRVAPIGLEQAKEAVELIRTLEETYGCPVLFGGDLNACEGSSSYEYFLEEGGCHSLQAEALASVYTSKLRTTHGYPHLQDGKMTAANPFTNKEAHLSIDNVLMRSLDKIDLHLYGVIADFCALRGSDHLPLLLDFDVK